MDNQIIRIPYKYWELINTMEDCECWKLMKALFYKDKSNLSWLSLTYYNIIIVDIENLENMVKKWQKWGKKWGRPPKGKTQGVNEIKTPPFWKTKPKISKDKINKDKINKDNISSNNNIINTNIINKENFIKKYEITEKELNDEIDEFIWYWTAIVRKWKKSDIWKQLRETKETFEPNRRFITWLRNNNKWKKRIIVNNEDEERKRKLAELEEKKKALFNNL